MIDSKTIVLLWWAFGLASFIYWWTKQHDLTIADLMIGSIAALLGPFCFLIGQGIHSRPSKPFIIMRKRS